MMPFSKRGIIFVSAFSLVLFLFKNVEVFSTFGDFRIEKPYQVTDDISVPCQRVQKLQFGVF